jgi:hypothetical protein
MLKVPKPASIFYLNLSITTGTQKGTKFDGTVYSNENKAVMTTSGQLTITNDAFKLDSKLFDVTSKKEVVALKTDILPNRGHGFKADIDLTTPDKTRSFKIHCKFSLFQKMECSFLCLFSPW